jgi:hypothetical protein
MGQENICLDFGIMVITGPGKVKIDTEIDHEHT